MAWTSPKTWASGDVLTASDMNTYVRDNSLYLLTSRIQSYRRTSGNYTISSSSFADVDGTNLAFTRTSNSTQLEVIVSGGTSNSANDQNQFVLSLDGTDTPVLFFGGGTGGVTFCFMQVFTVTAGVSHTIKLRWRAVSGTGTLYGTNTADAFPAGCVSMTVQEIG